ncbi:Uncharacterised protein [Mycobacteroides abscessus subsp. bolletii]|nr:Uncharacterised protein [Mycobacteroides abscessus subsp. bolletii]
MIEISGTRYAVGTRTAKTMWWGAVGVTISYIFFLPPFTVALLRRYHVISRSWQSDWFDLWQPLGAMFMSTGVALCGLVLMIMTSADSQKVSPESEDVKPTKWQRLLAFLPIDQIRSKYGWPFLAWIAALLAAYGVGVKLGYAVPSILLMLTMLGFMALHSVRLIALARHMSSEAKIKVDDRVDECRDFEWDRYGNSEDDEAAFRSKFHDKRWKFPGLMEKPQEAERYATKARSNRLAALGANALLGLMIVALVNQPVINFVQTMARGFAHPSLQLPPPSTWDTILMQFLMLMLLIPVWIQIKASNLETLAKIYEDRAKELRETARAQMRPATRVRPYIVHTPRKVAVDPRYLGRRPAQRSMKLLDRSDH